MSDEDKKSVKSSDIVLDPDFTEEEHKEFEKLEKENPYKEIEEETIRIPKRKEHITETRHDLLYLGIFCIILAVFLVILIFKPFG